MKFIPILKIFVFLLLLLLSAYAVKLIDDNAYIYVGLAWIPIFGLYIKMTKTERSRLIAIYSGSTLIAFFLAEIYFSGILGKQYENTKIEKQMIYGEGIALHDILGYAPSKESQWSQKLTYHDTVIYDVIQTVDNTGFRYSPMHSSTKNAVLFLGCSFTFGAGLNDDETLPYRFGQLSSGPQGINMGINSYGAQHTLSMLQNRMDTILTNGKMLRAGIYTAITDHVFRGTGQPADLLGPIYALSSNGQLVFQGVKFRYDKYTEHLRYELSKSHLLKRLLFGRKPAREIEIDLFMAMLRASRDLFIKRYNAPFYCVIWDEVGSEPDLYEKLLTRLNNEQFNVIEIKDILPNYQQNKSRYAHDHDGHPTAMTNKLIAQYLANFLTQNIEDN